MVIYDKVDDQCETVKKLIKARDKSISETFFNIFRTIFVNIGGFMASKGAF